MSRMKYSLLVGGALATVLCGGHTSHAEEQNRDLFDGKTLAGWTTADGKPVTKGWAVEEGMLVRANRGGAIFSKEEFGDFDLRFEWKIAPRGNSGVKYRLAFYKEGVRGHPGWLGCEYQVFDDAGRKTNPITSAGSLYGLVAPNDQKKLKPTGQFNTSRIVARGTKIEHWLNGKKIVEATIGSDDWKQRIVNSKFGAVDSFFQNPKGRIQLQDHGSRVWFRSITIRDLSEK